MKDRKKFDIEIQKPNGEIETYKQHEIPLFLLMKALEVGEIKYFKVS